ncbi:hypothetical protein AB0D97_12850 [Streptomyces roseus]|uniref:hypothetical protein n=1 Tax=Streptomyces roseus TaxID=66430 RepID=UPI00340FBF2F
MADTLPIDTGSPARAALAPAGIASLDVPLAQLDADLKVIAARREMAGLLAEQRHQLNDPAVPPLLIRPYLNTGGQP